MGEGREAQKLGREERKSVDVREGFPVHITNTCRT